MASDDPRPMKALVTGASGFIGLRLCATLSLQPLRTPAAAVLRFNPRYGAQLT